MTPSQRAPKGLGPAGRRTWREILAAVDPAVELDERERLILGEACRTADLMQRLETAIDDEGVITAGAAGQRRVNGAVGALVQARGLYARLLSQIQLQPPQPRTGHLNGRQRAELHRIQGVA